MSLFPLTMLHRHWQVYSAETHDDFFSLVVTCRVPYISTSISNEVVREFASLFQWADTYVKSYGEGNNGIYVVLSSTNSLLWEQIMDLPTNLRDKGWTLQSLLTAEKVTRITIRNARVNEGNAPYNLELVRQALASGGWRILSYGSQGAYYGISLEKDS